MPRLPLAHVSAGSLLAPPADYARSQPGVYFVTIQQLLEWQRDPVPLSKLSDKLGCGISLKTAGAPVPAPSQGEGLSRATAWLADGGCRCRGCMVARLVSAAMLKQQQRA